MTRVSIIGPDDGESIRLGPAVRMRILEDGSTTGHRLGVAEGTLAPHTAGPPQHHCSRIRPNSIRAARRICATARGTLVR